MADSVTCNVCGAQNPAGVQFCESCGVELAPAAKGAPDQEIDRLLAELTELQVEPGTGESLDIDKEIVDDLLDSLLVEEEGAEAFECPLCGTRLSVDAKSCPKCGAMFAEVEAETVAVAEPATRPPPAAIVAEAPRPAVEGEPAAVPVSVTDEALPSSAVRSGRMVDLVVLGTIGGLVAVFLLFQMYSWPAVAGNPLGLAVFGGIAVGGMAAGFGLFRVSTGAIATGDRLVKEGRYEDALYYYERAIRTGSRPASAWTSKGVALKRLGRLDEAMASQNAALKLDPEMEIAWCNKGDIHFRAENLAKAIECYDRAIKIRPRYAIAWNNKGAALARQGRFDEARRCHDEAVRLKPKYVAAWLNRGEVLARLGRADEAQRCLERARALGA